MKLDKRKKELAYKAASIGSKWTNKLVLFFFAMIIISTLTNLNRSEKRTEFILYEKKGEGKSARTEYFKFRTKHIPKPVMNKNLLDLSYDLKGGRTIGYRRNIGKLLFFDTYAGVSYGQSATGHQTVGVGISIGF